MRRLIPTLCTIITSPSIHHFTSASHPPFYLPRPSSVTPPNLTLFLPLAIRTVRLGSGIVGTRPRPSPMRRRGRRLSIVVAVADAVGTGIAESRREMTAHAPGTGTEHAHDAAARRSVAVLIA
ncbi:hypothetical protein PG994_008538 [Apiospora phragmitis]|uniref:Uncharacterized protein n=1 Tax=Apiospora phragmitis TaxID=2905665 RepID=A0ABR1UGR0_9PEZI